MRELTKNRLGQVLVYGLVFLSCLSIPMLAVAGDLVKGDKSEKSVESLLTGFPTDLASFGAVQSGNWIYVFGGHTGRAHEHSRQNLNGTFYRLSTIDRRTVQLLPGGKKLQSVALVKYGTKLIRVGGLRAYNNASEPEKLVSVTDCQIFDPLTNRWSSLKPLPKGRSSHDAIVLKHRLYVFGGWELNNLSVTWYEHGLSLDLRDPKAEWQKIDQPFKTRALAVTANLDNETVVVIGGMNDGNKVSQSVHCYSPKHDGWKRLADLPGSGFGTSACFQGKRILATDWFGNVYSYDSNNNKWETCAQLFIGRFFHRLIAVGSSKIAAVAGASMGGKVRSVEWHDLRHKGVKQSHFEWDFPCQSTSRQAIFELNSGIYFLGGNRRTEAHSFEPKDFTDHGYRFNFQSLTVQRIRKMPNAAQSFATVVIGSDTKRAILLGGFGNDGSGPKARSVVNSLNCDSGEWKTLSVTLPKPLTQFGYTKYKKHIWVFGGLDYNEERGDKAFQHQSAIYKWRYGDLDGLFEKQKFELPQKRRAFAFARIGSEFFVVGGFSDNFQLVSDCLKLDLRNGEFTKIPKPRFLRSAAQAVSFRGKVYVAGGIVKDANGKFAPCRAIEEYNPQTKTWRTLIENTEFNHGEVRLLKLRNCLILLSSYNKKKRIYMRLIQPD